MPINVKTLNIYTHAGIPPSWPVSLPDIPELILS
jgi:hypothetical protein